jgi:hypothetical protein
MLASGVKTRIMLESEVVLILSCVKQAFAMKDGAMEDEDAKAVIAVLQRLETNSESLVGVEKKKFIASLVHHVILKIQIRQK